VRRKAGAWDGAQPRPHVLKVLREHGVQLEPIGDDFYACEDLDGVPCVMHIPEIVISEVVLLIWRRFGGIHDFPITALVKPRPKH